MSTTAPGTTTPPVCVYEREVHDACRFETSCGHTFHLTPGGDLYDYCPHCGKLIEENLVEPQATD